MEPGLDFRIYSSEGLLVTFGEFLKHHFVVVCKKLLQLVN
jgi:hypothetical protein